MKDVIDYIRSFLVFGDVELAEQVGYTANETVWGEYRVVIVPGENILNGGRNEWSEPDLTAIPPVEKRGNTSVILDDIIYNTLFCISLAGEHLERDVVNSIGRDEHGRIPSEESTLGRQGLRMRPVIDEYSELVLRLLETELPASGFSGISLTHDVDSICRYRHLRGFLGGIRRGKMADALKSLTDVNKDPIYTFEWMHHQDSKVAGAEEIYFFKAGKGRGLDYPQYNLSGTDFRKLRLYLKSVGAKIGLHGSYEAAESLKYKEEKSSLERNLDETVHLHRNHYLRLCSYDQLQCLSDAGFTDDYTIGWADHIGFRLGTTRPVRWINPQTLRLTGLTLHPLCIMDCTLSEQRYMGISDKERAVDLCVGLIETVRKYHGELVLLWHNSIFAESGFHRFVYREITDYLSPEPVADRKILHLGMGEKFDYDRSKTFIDLFIQQAAKTPEQVAVADRDGRLSYLELDRLSNALAFRLISMGVKRDDFIIVKMPRVKEFVAAVLGIWKAGGAYVPIDPEYPEERIRFMLEDSCAEVMITDQGIVTSNRAVSEQVCRWEELEPFHSSVNRSVPEGLAYMIYTSGSTGRPKGVMIGHDAYFNYLNFYVRQQGLSSSDRMGCHRNFCFDASLEDLFPILTVGGELHLMPDEIRKDLSKIRNFILKRGITCISFTTSLGEMLLREYPDLPLRFMVVSGEKLNPVENLHVPLWNFYGPTECTVDCVTYPVEQGRRYDTVPIGRVVDNMHALILDSCGHIAPYGAAGELCIVGPQLSRGYWHNPELTAEKFVDCPYLVGQKMYRTGDLCRWNEDGNLEYMGRIDNQVKLRGFRIELGEIEAAMLAVGGISSAVAEVKNLNGSAHLFGYYVSEEHIDETVMKDVLGKTLPDYMIPDAFVCLETLPLTPNGKIDRKTLPVPELKVDEIVSPETERERQLFAVVSEELGTDRFGVTTNLLSMGLTSIRAIRLSASIRKQLELWVPTAEILSHPCIREWNPSDRNDEEEIPVLPHRPYYPITENQRGLYIDWVRHSDGIQYNIPRAYVFKGVHGESLVSAVEHILEVHPYLKTHLSEVDGEIVQQRRDDAEIPVLYEHLEKEPSAAFFQSRVRPFNLLEDDLARFEVYSTETAAYLFYDVHHIIFDGGSMNILLSDIFRTLKGKSVVEEQVTAYDYSLYYHKWKHSDLFLEYRKYFENLVSGTESFLYPVSRADVSLSGKSAIFTVNIPIGNIRIVCRNRRITENVFFATVLTQVFHRISREENIQIVTLSNGRSLFQLAETVGMFVQTLPLVCRRFRGPISDILYEIQRQMIETVRRDKYPFTEMVDRLALKPNVLYAYQGDVIGLHHQEAEHITLSLDTAKIPLFIAVLPLKESYELTIEYDSGLYTPTEMEILGHTLVLFAENLAESLPDSRIENVPLVSIPESEALTRLGTGEKIHFDERETIAGLFIKQAAKMPDLVASVDGNGRMTYRELDERSNAVAHWLIDKCRAGMGDYVAVMLPRVKEFIVAVLGIWKAGAAYVPLDPSLPEQRVAFIIEDSKSKAVITPEILLKIDYTYTSPVNYSKPDGPAYVIYTSGSTGTPKGTIVSHTAFTSFTYWCNDLFHQGEGSRHLVYASFSFDISIIEMFCPLAVGGEVHIPDEETRLDAHAISRYICEHRINGVTFPTEMGMILLNNYDISPDYVILAGERMYPVKKGRAKVFNDYGPCEFGVGSTLYEVKGDETNVPIGRPVPNCMAKLCDAEGGLVPKGMIGELYLGGVQLGLGYLNRDNLNREKYVDGWYKTGDLCRWNEDGNLEYMGRIDNQVKLRGFRIEPGEVEAAMLAVGGISSAVAEVKNMNGSAHLCGYYVSEEPMDETVLKEVLGKTLADYMIPDVFVRLDEIPLTPNGKIDRKALPAPELNGIREMVPPRTLLEKSVCMAFRQVLNMDEVGIDDDFFSIGGDSVKVFRLQVLCRDIELSAGDVFRLRTPRLIAGFLKERNPENVPLEIPASVPLNAAQSGIFVECMKKRGEPVYHIARLYRLSETIELNRLCKALETAVSAHPGLFAEIFVDSDGILSQKPGDTADFSIEPEEMSDEIFNESKDRLVVYCSLLKTRLFRIRVIRTPSAGYLFCDFHHIILDGESLDIFLHDVEDAYRGNVVYPETFTGFHYALLERERRESPYFEECRQWFSDTFAEAGPTSLPECDLKPEENEEEDSVNCSSLTVPSGLSRDELSGCARRFGVTENILAITAFGKMLGDLNGTKKAVFTTIHNGRNDYRTAGTVSMMVRMIPVFMEWKESDGAGKLMTAEKEQMTGCIAHDIFSFAELCAQTSFDSRVSFVYLDNPGGREMLCGAPCQEISLKGFTAEEPLMVHLLNETDGLYLRAEYRSDMFSEKRIGEILKHYIIRLKLFFDCVIEF